MKINKKNLYTKIISFSFAALIFTIPTNLFKKFFENSAYVHGLRVDYLISKIYLSDFLIILLLGLLLINKNNREKLKKTIIAIKNKLFWISSLATLILMLFSTQYQIIGIQLIVRVLLLLTLGTLLIKNKKLLSKKIITTSIKATIIFQSLVSLYQYIFQKSVANYYFFGETNLNTYAGLAKSTVGGAEKILPYGTTAHPNVLAGVLTIFSLVLFNQLIKEKKYNLITVLILLLAGTTILLTQSLSAILGLILGILTILYLTNHKNIFTLKKIVLLYLVSTLLVVPIFSLLVNKKLTKNFSIYRRDYLNTAAIKMFQANPIGGVGLGNFVTELENYSNKKEVVRFVQPVHNSILLLLSETGIIGIVIIFALLKNQLSSKTKINKKTFIKHPEYLLALLPIVTLDHYLLTLQSGILLLFLTYLTTKELVEL